MHNTQSLALWMQNKPSDLEVGCAQLGTTPMYEFSCKQRKGAEVWDAAWLQKPSVLNWMCIARSIVNQNTTCKGCCRFIMRCNTCSKFVQEWTK